MSSQRGNEEEIGQALSEVFSDWLVNRPDVWVTGKFWPEGDACPTPAQIREQLKQTLASLKLEYLDLYLLPANKNEKAFKVCCCDSAPLAFAFHLFISSPSYASPVLSLPSRVTSFWCAGCLEGHGAAGG